MSMGDVISDLQNIGAGANLDFQPAAGVEALIFGFGGTTFVGISPNQVPDILVQLWDGALNAYLVGQAIQPMYNVDVRMYINNSRYLRINNNALVAQDICYYGIQTK